MLVFPCFILSLLFKPLSGLKEFWICEKKQKTILWLLEMILALKINAQLVTEQIVVKEMFAGLTVAIRSSLCTTVNNKMNFIPEMEYLI